MPTFENLESGLSVRTKINAVITTVDNNSGNWSAAFSWGNHATEGYITSAAIASLTDVDLTGLAVGNVLSWDGADWVPSAGASVPIGDLTDVVSVAPSTGQILLFDGTNWVNANLAASDVTYIPTFNLDATSVQDAITQLDEVKQPAENGFSNRSDSTISFDDATRTFTIAPVGAEYTVFSDRNRYVKTAPESIQIPDAEGSHFFYFDASGTLVQTQTFVETIITDFAFIAYVYWNFDAKEKLLFGDERHGNTMDSATHLYNHNTFGARYGNGLQVGDVVADGSGDLATDAQFSITGGRIWDEDLELTLPTELVGSTNVRHLYKTGPEATFAWRELPSNGFVVADNGAARARYNQLVGGSWQLTEVGNNNLVLAHLFATNDVEAPWYLIMGEEEYSSVGSARDAAGVELFNLITDGLFTIEYVAVATFIVQTGSAYSNDVASRIRSTDSGEVFIDWRGIQAGALVSLSGAGTVQTAAQVPFTPTGDIAATDVQAALAELDTEKATAAQGALADTAVQPLDDAATLGSGAATDGFVLTADGVGGTAWEAGGGGGGVGGLTVLTVSVNTTAVTGTHYHVDTAAVTITLPATPSIDDQVGVSVDNFTNTVVAANGSLINGVAQDITIDIADAYVEFRYVSATEGWTIVSQATSAVLSSGIIPVGTENQVIRYGAGGAAEATSDMIIDANGNVGIGGTSPLSPLDVDVSKGTRQEAASFGVNASAGAKLHITPYTTAATNRMYLSFNSYKDSLGAFQNDTLVSAGMQYIGFLDSGDLTFATDAAAAAAAPTERMRILANGNVGIGETTVVRKLHVSSTLGTVARIESTNVNAQSFIEYKQVGGDTKRVYGGNNDGNFVFLTGVPATERMRIDSSGDVGIGVISPDRRLHVKDTTQVVAQIDSTNVRSYLEFSDSGTTNSNGSLIGSAGNDLIVANGTSNLERMRIDSAGDVGIGSSAPSARLEVAEDKLNKYATVINSDNATSPFGLRIDYRFGSPNSGSSNFLFCLDSTTTRAAIRSNGGFANFSANDTNLSDERAKKDIELSSGYLDKLLQIPVKNFRYKTDSADGKRHLGVIAQDVDVVAPEFVDKSSWEYQGEMMDSVYNTDLMFAMLKAIQEQQEMIDTLKDEVATLKESN